MARRASNVSAKRAPPRRAAAVSISDSDSDSDFEGEDEAVATFFNACDELVAASATFDALDVISDSDKLIITARPTDMPLIESLIRKAQRSTKLRAALASQKDLGHGQVEFGFTISG